MNNKELVPATLADLPERTEIEASVDRVLADELYWFPVRHNSPVVAHHVERALLHRRPKIVFLEAPADLQSLIPHVVDPRTRPPVALYASFKPAEGSDARARASWYPLVPYSPELVTIRTAAKLGAEVSCMDLPHDRQTRPEAVEPTEAESSIKRIDQSEFYRQLAAAAGYRKWDEAWDTLFEQGYAQAVETFRRELTTFSAAARATAPPPSRLDDTRPRERFMWGHIQRELSDRAISPAEAMVVCGGYHLFLDREDEVPPPSAVAGQTHIALVPYSYPRIWEQTGYGAGNRAPRFYQHIWDGTRRKASLADLMNEHAIDVLRRARSTGEHLAAADAIAVAHHANLLAQLRGRTYPVLDDIQDALISCCVKGDPNFEGRNLRKAMRDAEVGTRVGKVSPDAGRLPLARDYDQELERLELSGLLEHEKAIDLRLDRREPLDAERSAFLHRLRYLNIPIGDTSESASNPFGQTIFQERWRLGWKPEIEDALVNASLDGDTVKAASLRRLGDRFVQHRGTADATAKELLGTIRMDLSEMVAHAEGACGEAIDRDTRFISLVAALNHLLVMEGHATFRKLQQGPLTELIRRAYARSCFAVPEVANAPEEDHPQVLAGLCSLAEVILQRDDLAAVLFSTHVESAATSSNVPDLRGAFVGILVEIQAWPIDRLTDELWAYARSSPDQQLLTGDFLHGVLSVSRTAVLQGARGIVEALDGVLQTVEHEGFMALAPRLRAAFQQLPKRQRDTFAREVARYHGLVEDEILDAHFEVSAEAATLIAEIDTMVAETMGRWRL